MTSPEPASIGWNPSADDRLLLAGDETVLPCIATILKTLSPKSRGQVFIEVQSEHDIVALDAPGRFGISWLVRDNGQQLQRSVDAWLSEMLPVSGLDDYSVYAWMGVGRAKVLTSN